MGFLMPPHPLPNFEIQNYYQNGPRFNGVCSRDNLPRIRDRAYIINLDKYSDIGTQWIALCVQNNNVNYFDSFGVEHIPEEIKTFAGNKNIKAIIFRIQAHDSKMREFFCIGFIDFMLSGNTLADFKNRFHQISLKKTMT